jgi:hypothetical protein
MTINSSSRFNKLPSIKSKTPGGIQTKTVKKSSEANSTSKLTLTKGTSKTSPPLQS